MVDAASYDETLKKRLSHIKSHLDGGFDVGGLVNNIVNNQGNVRGCMSRLSSHAFASAMHAWFGRHDLSEMMQWCYVSSRLKLEAYKLDPDLINPLGKFLSLAPAMMSNNKLVMDGFAYADGLYDMKCAEKYGTDDFWAYLAVLALRHDWSEIRSRCELATASPKGVSKSYAIDHQFYLALSVGDAALMSDAIDQLLSPRALASRKNQESGFSEGIISSPAIIYVKLARLAGHDLKVTSPYVPLEWQSLEQLPVYKSHYEFLK